MTHTVGTGTSVLDLALPQPDSLAQGYLIPLSVSFPFCGMKTWSHLSNRCVPCIYHRPRPQHKLPPYSSLNSTPIPAKVFQRRNCHFISVAENSSGLEAEETTAGNRAGDFAEVPGRSYAGAGAHLGSDSAPRVSGSERWGEGSGVALRALVSIVSDGAGGYTVCMLELLLPSRNPGGPCCGLSCFTDEETESQGHPTTTKGHVSICFIVTQ